MYARREIHGTQRTYARTYARRASGVRRRAVSTRHIPVPYSDSEKYTLAGYEKWIHHVYDAYVCSSSVLRVPEQRYTPSGKYSI